MGVGEGETQQNIFTGDASIAFEGKCFQFSGTLEFGRREDAISVVEKLGGYTPSGNSLPGLVNYLVVGDLKKRALRRSGYGGIIKKAMKLNREAPLRIQIITERDFIKSALKAVNRFENAKPSLIGTTLTYKALSVGLSKVRTPGKKAVRVR